MKPYKSRSGKSSGVVGYNTGDDFIEVVFAGGRRYVYTYKSAGKEHVEAMKDHADRQKGLATYISQHNPGYQ